jgi:hypothetical protein
MKAIELLGNVVAPAIRKHTRQPNEENAKVV